MSILVWLLIAGAFGALCFRCGWHACEKAVRAELKLRRGPAPPVEVPIEWRSPAEGRPIRVQLAPVPSDDEEFPS